jgi:L-asparaginase
MADEIHAARRVRKTHSSSLTAFQSPTGGPVGYVIGGSPRFLSPAHDRPVIPTDPGRSGAAPRVGLVVTSLGDDGAMLDGMAQRYDGLVVAGFGVGHVPAGHVEPLEGLAATIPVVLTSRTGAGPVLLSTYSFPGSELDLLARGLIPAGLLDPYKARILLHLLIATGCDRSTIHDAFEAAGGHTDPSSWPWPPQDGPGVEA